MPLSISFNNIRPLNGSQHAAFEELCCQLAASESVPSGSHFIRKGAPDAGLECYWHCTDNSEQGWQAKFFLSTPQDTQWRQLDESVKTALDKHPNLSQYTVCLPLDRQDPHITDQEWFMDKWDSHVKKWGTWADTRGMKVEFRYWGSHEILKRLSRHEHQGRSYFWFQHQLFTPQWFELQVETAIRNVGPRYSPELNVNLSIARTFYALGRTPEFQQRVKMLLKNGKKHNPPSDEKLLADKPQLLQKTLNELWQLLETATQNGIVPIDWESIKNYCHSAMEISSECLTLLNSYTPKSTEEPDQEQKRQSEQRNNMRYFYREIISGLNETNDLAVSQEASLTNTPQLLLAGEAGTGVLKFLCKRAREHK
jgi:hypothetical protein